MTTKDMVSRIEKMGIKVTVNDNPDEKEIQRIKEIIKSKESYGKGIQKNFSLGLKLHAETNN